MQALRDARPVPSEDCVSVTVGLLADSPVVLATTGEGFNKAELCVSSLLRCSAVVKEMMYFGTAGFSPRVGGVLNPPTDCEAPREDGLLLRPGDLCVAVQAVNWECQNGDWSQTSAAYPNVCSLPADARQVFEGEASNPDVDGFGGKACAFLSVSLPKGNMRAGKRVLCM